LRKAALAPLQFKDALSTQGWCRALLATESPAALGLVLHAQAQARFCRALSMAPIANVFSVLQSAPIIVTAFVAAFWGEKVGLSRWAAVLVGFIGVALIVRPPGHQSRRWTTGRRSSRAGAG
jgi:drug/metabolite transporter (DMT)-like permease